MTEWEKLKAGLVYNDFDEELFRRRVDAKKLFREYNRTDDSETEKRISIMTDLFNEVGNNVWIEPDFRCEYGKNISIGNDVYINFGCIILDCAEVTIGNNVLFGPNVGIYVANHSFDPEERAQGGCFGKPVHICDKVWLGGDVKILAGVTIGVGAIIGTGSIVTKDIPEGVIAAGNPCRIIRKLTDNDKTDYLREQ
ncbi:sugar O-acetyltransferase [Dysgonomonas mossii]|uniref:sugar O-acetyltransferase n=1 Tax=Dysgonomonas mossii TaxID=163665 RepID=UPI0039934364